jgi:oligoendopeptidase F
MTATRRFVPADLDIADVAQLTPIYRRLLDRPIVTVIELRRWLEDVSELSAAVDEFGQRRFIDKSCHTDDAEVERRFLHFVEIVEPAVKPLFFALQKKFVEHPLVHELNEPGDRMLRRNWSAEVELFREENVALETQAAKLVNEYDKLFGAMTVEFRGERRTLQQLAKFLEEPDRATRQEAWELIVQRRLTDREAIEAIFNQLVPIRQKIAENSGFADYRGYVWKSFKRFDYSPADSARFAEAVEQTCVPLVRQLDRQRQRLLRVDRLRPWDLEVDERNRPALRPFEADGTDRFVEGTEKIFRRMSPALAEDFATVRREGNLDLFSRIGKQPGGYQASLEEVRQPFIFMNAVGTQSDVETLLHEGGHAFHYLAAREEPVMFLRSAPIEFCEVASMSMELLGAEHFDEFYSPAGAARARQTMLEGVVRLLPHIATIDQFQHWIYSHPGHTPAERTAHWLSLLDRFGGLADFGGYESARSALWQRQLHLFSHPFYYIEYGIAQLGALQLWMKAQTDPHQAIEHYRAALRLGGTRTLPELFAAAGISFDFSAGMLGPLMRAVRDQLAPI